MISRPPAYRPHWIIGAAGGVQDMRLANLARSWSFACFVASCAIVLVLILAILLWAFDATSFPFFLAAFLVLALMNVGEWILTRIFYDERVAAAVVEIEQKMIREAAGQ